MTHTETASAASTGRVPHSPHPLPVRLTHAQTADVTMMIEAMTGMSDLQIYATVFQFLEQRPDVAPLDLHAHANRLSRLADEKERG